MILEIYWKVKELFFYTISSSKLLTLTFVAKQGYVLYLMRQRIYNSRYYQKKDKREERKQLEVQADKADHEKIYKQLEVELKKKNGSVSAVREMMVLTFKQRRSETTKIEDANPTKVVLQKFPFLDKELAVSIAILLNRLIYIIVSVIKKYNYGV